MVKVNRLAPLLLLLCVGCYVQLPTPKPVQPDIVPQPLVVHANDAEQIKAFAARIDRGTLVDSDEAYLTLQRLVQFGDLSREAADKIDAKLSLKTDPRQLTKADAEQLKGLE